MFKKFNEQLKNNFESWTTPLFITNVDPDKMWEKYLESFPEGSDPVYKERTEHDCTCCRHFVKRYGNVVTIIDGKMVSIWDINTFHPYDEVCKKMAVFVKTQISDVFLNDTKNMGTATSLQKTENGVKQWNHFFCNTPTRCISKEIPTDRGNKRTNKEMLARCMNELTIDAAQTIIELIDQGSIYRGEEFKNNILEFIKLKKLYDAAENKEWWTWLNLDNPFVRIRNTAIGTLLIDISENVDLEVAVKKFESIMAPTNYKRPKAIITKKMVKDAENKINDLGLSDSLARRFARVEDITVDNVLFVNRDTGKKISSIFDELDTVEKPREFKKVKEITIDDFISNVLPTTTSLKVMVENKHESNFVSLIAPQDKEAAPLFKWDNNFCWTYNGDITDSMREAVVAAGGRVDGVFRFTHSWNHDGNNQSLMDLHVFLPTHKGFPDKKTHDEYGTSERVGWNHRSHHRTKGVQDVDFVSPPGKAIPLENITFPDLNIMPEGKYVCRVHNWNARNPNRSGFKAQIEFEGQIFDYEHKEPLRNKEWVTVAEVTLKNGKFSIDHKVNSSTTQKTIWGIKTNDFVDVSLLTTSPNHWNHKTGNKHYIFVLKGCKNEGNPRGFFNEFLKEELTPHKRVFEALGSKMRVEESDEQLSGIGFSSTKSDSVIVEVEGKTKRVMKINF